MNFFSFFSTLELCKLAACFLIILEQWFVTFISLSNPYVILLWFEKIFLIFHSLGPFLFKLLDFVLVFISELFFSLCPFSLVFFCSLTFFFIFYTPLAFFFFFSLRHFPFTLWPFFFNSPSTSIQRKGANYKDYYQRGARRLGFSLEI